MELRTYPQAPILNVRFRGKPLDDLTREEAIEALKQALMRVAELEGKPFTVEDAGIRIHVTSAPFTSAATSTPERP